MSATPAATKSVLLVPLIAFCSGASALIYQINWQRDLTFIFGVSHYATTTIVFAFFLGFSVGAWLSKSRVDRASVFLTVAALEAVIGLFAWGSPLVFDLVGLAAGKAAAFSGGPGALAMRAVLCTLAILIPTACMGATLPVFYRAGVDSMADRGRRIGFITGMNSAGAVAGSFITTFFWMGRLSTDAQIHWASALNFLGVAIALALHRTATAPLDFARDERGDSAQDERGRDHRMVAAYVLSGAAGLGLEILWNRLVFLTLDHTIYSFALTLSVYLASYTAGSLLAGPWLRRNPASRRSVATLQILCLVATVAGLMLYRMGIHVAWFSERLGYFGAATLVVSSFVMVPTFLMGLAMPQVFVLLTGKAGSLGRDASHAQMMNNLGSMFAIFMVGFVLLPTVGVPTVALFCTLLLLLGAVLLLEGAPGVKTGRLSIYAGAGALAMLLSLMMYGGQLHRGHIANTYLKPVAILEDESGVWGLDQPRPTGITLKLNGYFENYMPLPPTGTIQGDFLIPAMVHPKLDDVYMIGLGLGVGAHELLRLPEVKRFDAAELSSGAISLAQATWKRYGGGFFADPRFHVLKEDGRLLLERSDHQYDAIVSGTNRSFYAGSTHLYSVEYWQTVKARLRTGGVFLQWLPVYSEYSAAVLLKTFLAVFPDALVLTYTNYIYMIGFRDGLPADLGGQVARAYARAPELLATTDIPSPQDLFARLYRSNGSIEKTSLDLNRDSNPVVEYSFRGFEFVDDGGYEGLRAKFLVPLSN